MAYKGARPITWLFVITLLCRLYDNFFVFALHCSVGIAPTKVYTPLFPLNKQLASILLYQD
jgi:hypothetical protein